MKMREDVVDHLQRGWRVDVDMEVRGSHWPRWVCRLQSRWSWSRRDRSWYGGCVLSILDEGK